MDNCELILRLMLSAYNAVTSSFLPQDKVSEFAQMTPQQLLRETQRAAGDSNLTKWHDTLITSGKELKAVQEVMFAHHTKIRQVC